MGRQWRVALRLARRDARRHPVWSVLVVLLVAATVAGGTFVEIVQRTDGSKALERMRVFGPADAGLIVNGQGEGAWHGPPPSLDPTLLPPGTHIARAADQSRVGLLSAAGARVATDVLVLDLAEPLTRNRARLLSGRAPAVDEALVNRALARELGLLDGDRLRPDARLTLADRTTVSVTGLALNSECIRCSVAVVPFGSRLEGPGAAIRPQWAQCCVMLSWAAKFDYFLDVPEGTDLLALKASLNAIENLGTESEPRPRLDLEPIATTDLPSEYHGFITPLAYRIRAYALTALLAGLGMLEIVLLCGTAFAIGVRRQTRVLGLLAAQGAGRRSLRRVVLAQALLLGTVGAAVGVPLGLLATRLTDGWWERRSNAAVDVWAGRPHEIAAVAVLGVVAVLLAALMPAVQVSRRQILDALAGRLGARTGRARRWPVLVGLVMLGTGVVLGIRGSRAMDRTLFRGPSWQDGVQVGHNMLTFEPSRSPILQVLLGCLAAVAGVVLLTPSLLGIVGRWPGRLPVSVRLAARDTARRRSRTAPTTAAIAVAVAGAVGMSLLAAADDHATYLREGGPPPAVPHVVIAEYNGFPTVPERNRPATDLALTRLPGAREIPVTAVDLPDPHGYEEDGLKDRLPRRSEWCPTGSRDCLLSAAELTIANIDLIRLGVGTEPLDEAAVTRALDAGEVVVLDPFLVDGEGRVHVVLPGGIGALDIVALPATLFPRSSRTLLPSAFVSEETARAHGWGTRPQSTVVTHAAVPDPELRAVIAEVEAVGLSVRSPDSDGPRHAATGPDAWAGAAALLAVLGVTIPLALCAVDGSSDVATLAAVGAAPRRRRRMAATQSLLLAGIGGIVGLLLGFGFARAARPATGSDVTVVPWAELGGLLVAVPLLALAVGLAATLRRPSFVRRAD